MKFSFILYIFAASLTLTACTAASADDYVEVYEDGVENVGDALTKNKLAKITYDVQDEINGLENRLGNIRKMSDEDSEKVLAAQKKFYHAVEKRDRELSK